MPYIDVVDDYVRELNQMMSNFECPINAFQEAVIGTAICLALDNQFVSMVVGYGRGKSSCYFGVALYFAAVMKKKVLVLYANKGLQRKDEKLLTDMQAYCDVAYQGFDKLVRYDVGLKKQDNFKPDYVLLDESDALIFPDALRFYNQIVKWNSVVIGFTAKEFVGDGLISEK